VTLARKSAAFVVQTKGVGDWILGADKLLDHWRNACGTYLGRLAAKCPNRFKETRTATRRSYTIWAPPNTPEDGA
jgi:hypothetical protein